MESKPYHITSTKTPSHTDTIWLNGLSPQLSYLISHTEPMKYGEINPLINSLAGPTNRLTHSPTSYVTQQFGREVCFTNANALASGLAAISLLGSGPMPKSSPTTSIDTLHQTTACTYTEAFRRLNGETSRAHTTTTKRQEWNWIGPTTHCKRRWHT
jgi:hypothetical protein